jgi:hypothetical protein
MKAKSLFEKECDMTLDELRLEVLNRENELHVSFTGKFILALRRRAGFKGNIYTSGKDMLHDYLDVLKDPFENN